MAMTEERYINPYTDFGFKKLFGTELNKELLMSFLNALFDGKQVVTDIHYLNGEHLGAHVGERRAIFDVYCENEQGETFYNGRAKVCLVVAPGDTVYFYIDKRGNTQPFGAAGLTEKFQSTPMRYIRVENAGGNTVNKHLHLVEVLAK